MAIYKIFPTKDTSIYTEDVDLNSGLDQILEASTYVSNLDNTAISRYLIQFSQDEINDIINNKINNSTFNVYLKNYAALVTGLTGNSMLYFYPVSESWNMGTGRYDDKPAVTNGCSWKYKTFSGSEAWLTSGFAAYSTASFPTGKDGGGTWFTGSNLGLNIIQSQSFNYYNPIDINVDVTNTIKTWYSNSVNSNDGFPNNGFIVKQPDSEESNVSLNNTHIFRYFSIDTNTIYPPQLEFKWDDYSFSTGSSTNTILNTAESKISVYNNEGTYYSESITRFRIAAIPKYPARQFITASLYTTNYYLPESQSLYAIKDSSTNEFVIDFDSTYTRISADTNSSYFDIYMSGLEPERYYNILIQTIIEGNTKVWDENIMFKVVKG